MGVLLATAVESKLLLVALTDKDGEKKAFSRSIVAYHIPEDVLICSNNVTTSGTAEIVITTWLSLRQLIVIPQDPDVFCIDQMGKLKRDMVRITTSASF